MSNKLDFLFMEKMDEKKIIYELLIVEHVKI